MTCFKCGAKLHSHSNRYVKRRRGEIVEAHLMCPAKRGKKKPPAKKSRVFRDGREWLRGAKWRKRKAELVMRANGQCEGYLVRGFSDHPRHNLVIGHPHHLIFRSARHDDRLQNLALICPELHYKIHFGGASAACIIVPIN